MLGPESEYMLAKRWREHGDLQAAHRLVTSHLRRVAKLAMSYRGYGLPRADLISEGNVGLVRAVKRFDPERGFRLATYAMWWIRAALQEYVLHSWSLVKVGVTAAQKKLLFSLPRIKARLKAIDDGDLPPETLGIIARELAVPEADVVAMNRRLAAHDSSLNGSFADAVVADAEELGPCRDLLNGAMARVGERERSILAARPLSDPPETLEQFGQAYRVSRVRIRRIEECAYVRVLRSIKAAITDRGLVLQ